MSEHLDDRRVGFILAVLGAPSACAIQMEWAVAMELIEIGRQWTDRPQAFPRPP